MVLFDVIGIVECVWVTTIFETDGEIEDRTVKRGGCLYKMGMGSSIYGR